MQSGIHSGTCCPCCLAKLSMELDGRISQLWVPEQKPDHLLNISAGKKVLINPCTSFVQIADKAYNVAPFVPHLSKVFVRSAAAR